MTDPSSRVTVLMPVYNSVAYVNGAVESILGQTCGAFELLIVDDGSTDGSLEAVERLRDPRIQVVTSPTNRGIVDALNRGLAVIHTEYVARMDADDIAHPRRLEEQLDFMDGHPNIGASGTDVVFVRNGTETIWRFPTDPAEIKGRLFFHSPVAHPSSIFRTDVFRKFGISYRDRFGAEDWDLWLQCSRKFELSNLPKPLLRYRYNPNSVARMNAERTNEAAAAIAREELARLNIQATDREVELHRWLGIGAPETDRFGLQETFDWLVRLQNANDGAGLVESGVFEKIIFQFAERIAGNRIPEHLAFAGTLLRSRRRDSLLNGLTAAGRYIAGGVRRASPGSIARRTLAPLAR